MYFFLNINLKNALRNADYSRSTFLDFSSNKYPLVYKFTKTGMKKKLWFYFGIININNLFDKCTNLSFISDYLGLFRIIYTFVC